MMNSMEILRYKRIGFAAFAAILFVFPAYTLFIRRTHPSSPPPDGAAPQPAVISPKPNLIKITPSLSPIEPFQQQRDRLIAIHRPMEPLQPGDWLESHREAGQSFDKYWGTERKPRVDAHRRLLVVPIGDTDIFQLEIMQRAAEYLSANFGLPVEILDVVDVTEFPAEARRETSLGYGEQLLTRYILDHILPPRRSNDALAVLGMTTRDLWPGKGWNFVFGQASLSNRVGVWSLARYGDPSRDEATYRLALERTIKVALHETGHMIGIPHCTAYMCCMNGSNHLGETDRQPIEFCPECQAKIWWACRYDPVARLNRLAELARADGLQDAAEFWDAEAILLQENAATR